MNFRRSEELSDLQASWERQRAIDQWDLHQPKVHCALTSEKCTTGLAPSGTIQTQYKYHLVLSIRPYTATANSNGSKKPPNTSGTDHTNALGPPTRTSMALRPPGRLEPTPSSTPSSPQPSSESNPAAQGGDGLSYLTLSYLSGTSKGAGMCAAWSGRAARETSWEYKRKKGCRTRAVVSVVVGSAIAHVEDARPRYERYEAYGACG